MKNAQKNYANEAKGLVLTNFPLRQVFQKPDTWGDIVEMGSGDQ